MKYTLTKNQTVVLDFIKTCLKERGLAPTFQEIMDARGFKSKGQVSSLMLGLEERGHIVRITGKDRAIALVPDGHHEITQLQAIRDAANAFVHLQDGASVLHVDAFNKLKQVVKGGM
jgi:SOS-response transcriptional repressor LexA